MRDAATCRECGEPFEEGERRVPSHAILGHPLVHEECAALTLASVAATPREMREHFLSEARRLRTEGKIEEARDFRNLAEMMRDA